MAVTSRQVPAVVSRMMAQEGSHSSARQEITGRTDSTMGGTNHRVFTGLGSFTGPSSTTVCPAEAVCQPRRRLRAFMAAKLRP